MAGSLSDLTYAYYNGNGNGQPQGNSTNPSNVRVAPTAAVSQSKSVATSTTVLMAANAARTKFIIKNDAANAIWINLGAAAVAAAGSGNIKIAVGGYYELDAYNGAVNAIAETGAVNITAYEF